MRMWAPDQPGGRSWEAYREPVDQFLAPVRRDLAQPASVPHQASSSPLPGLLVVASCSSR